jgi:hypothetical protein
MKVSGLAEELALCEVGLADLEDQADRAWKAKNYRLHHEIKKEIWSLEQHVKMLEAEAG